MGLASKLSNLMSNRTVVTFKTCTVVTCRRGRCSIIVFYLTIVNTLFTFLKFGRGPTGVFVKSVNSLTLNNTLTTISVVIRRRVLLLLVNVVFIYRALDIVLRITSFGLANGQVFGVDPVRRRFRLYN